MLSEFDYNLPPELIAKYPLSERDASRMLVLDRKTGTMRHQKFRDLHQFLNPDDLLVLNNVKVMPARLIGHREGHTGKVEIFLLHPLNTDRSEWQVLMRPAKRLKPQSKVQIGELEVVILSQGEAGQGTVHLNWPSDLSLEELLEKLGQIPLPPYLAREADASDKSRYQTVFAKVSGAQAAPTAGLHFTPEVLKNLNTAEITLHVSAGTFRPVLTEDIDQHRMDPEYYEVSEDAAQQIEKANKLLCVGTTSLKTLETVALKHHGKIVAESGWSDLFIRPGFQFQVADMLLTNFHLPKSTLLMLVCAFASRNQIMSAYQAAISEQYRFYSYGDCMLII